MTQVQHRAPQLSSTTVSVVFNSSVFFFVGWLIGIAYGVERQFVAPASNQG